MRSTYHRFWHLKISFPMDIFSSLKIKIFFSGILSLPGFKLAFCVTDNSMGHGPRRKKKGS